MRCLAKGRTEQEISAPPPMVPVTPLPHAKGLVLRAFHVAGSRTPIARRAGVGETRVGQWADPEHTALPNLGHMLAAPEFGRVLAQGVIDHADMVAAVASMDEATLRREFIRLNTRASDLVLAADEAIAAGDDAALTDLHRKLTALGDHVRRISRALASMGAGK